MKKVAIIIQALPFNTIRNSEGLRCAVGLTIEEDNRVQVFFIDNGVWTAVSLNSPAAHQRDLDKHVETLQMMEVGLVVEEEALAGRGLEIGCEGIMVKSRGDINQAIMEADVAISF